MAIVMLQHAASLRDLARRIYGLAAEDPRVATAARALADTNPYLSADLRNLPPETPVVIPPIEGLAPVENPLPAVPQNANLLKLVEQIGETAGRIVTPPDGGAQTPAPGNERAALLERFAAARALLKLKLPEPSPVYQQAHAAQVKALRDDVAAFLKLHKG
jgi:hypothetical protein